MARDIFDTPGSEIESGDWNELLQNATRQSSFGATSAMQEALKNIQQRRQLQRWQDELQKRQLDEAKKQVEGHIQGIVSNPPKFDSLLSQYGEGWDGLDYGKK